MPCPFPDYLPAITLDSACHPHACHSGISTCHHAYPNHPALPDHTPSIGFAYADFRSRFLFYCLPPLTRLRAHLVRRIRATTPPAACRLCGRRFATCTTLRFPPATVTARRIATHLLRRLPLQRCYTCYSTTMNLRSAPPRWTFYRGCATRAFAGHCSVDTLPAAFLLAHRCTAFAVPAVFWDGLLRSSATCTVHRFTVLPTVTYCSISRLQFDVSLLTTCRRRRTLVFSLPAFRAFPFCGDSHTIIEHLPVLLFFRVSRCVAPAACANNNACAACALHLAPPRWFRLCRRAVSAFFPSTYRAIPHRSSHSAVLRNSFIVGFVRYSDSPRFRCYYVYITG